MTLMTLKSLTPLMPLNIAAIALPPPRKKVQPDLKVGLNLKAVIRLLKSEKPNS